MIERFLNSPVIALFLKMRWVHFLFRLKRNLSSDYAGLVAAGIAFYFLLAAFPALAAVISLYGIFSDPGFITRQLNTLSPFLPGDALSVLAGQAKTIVSSSGPTLSISFLISVVLTIYSATRGMSALIQGFNIAYNQKEQRNYFVFQATAFFMTLIMMIYCLVSLTLIAGIPTALHFIRGADGFAEIILRVRWPLLFVTALVGLQILYFYGPSQRPPRWRWFSWGAFSATTGWLVISGLFSLFVANFGNYNEVYGSISAIVVLLLWFWLSALMILLGAEVNSLLEEKHAAPSETGPAPPLRRSF